MEWHCDERLGIGGRRINTSRACPGGHGNGLVCGRQFHDREWSDGQLHRKMEQWILEHCRIRHELFGSSAANKWIKFVCRWFLYFCRRTKRERNRQMGWECLERSGQRHIIRLCEGNSLFRHGCLCGWSILFSGRGKCEQYREVEWHLMERTWIWSHYQ